MKAVKALKALFPYETDSENYRFLLKVCEEYDKAHGQPTQEEKEKFWENK